jgi:hypothetical protein
MPGWRVAPIDCTDVIQSGGALHCVTMNVPAMDDPRAKARAKSRSAAASPSARATRTPAKARARPRSS